MIPLISEINTKITQLQLEGTHTYTIELLIRAKNLLRKRKAKISRLNKRIKILKVHIEILEDYSRDLEDLREKQ